MSSTKPNRKLVNDLTCALEVMEEYSHLGPDDEAATKIRDIILRQINEAQSARFCSPVSGYVS